MSRLCDFVRLRLSDRTTHDALAGFLLAADRLVEPVQLERSGPPARQMDSKPGLVPEQVPEPEPEPERVPEPELVQERVQELVQEPERAQEPEQQKERAQEPERARLPEPVQTRPSGPVA